MKKILIIVFSLLLLVGCGKKKEEDVIKEFENKVTSVKNYHLTGDMEIINNEDKYNYTVDVTYKKGNYYKVSLINKENSHEQIILKNEDGVYVVTPSLNKSFKFQSEWPTNSSQSYILETILNDVLNDSERTTEVKKDTYIIKSKVNYPNNSDLKEQLITLDKEYLPNKVEVKNSKGITSIKMIITKIDTKTNYEKDYFSLKSSICENCAKETETTASLDNIVYPMYLPSGTTYSGEEVVDNNGSERVILSYTGVKPFILVEENAKSKEKHETTLVSGEVVQYGPVLGIITETSLNWNSDGKEYYIIGESLSNEELLQIASSTATVALTK